VSGTAGSYRERSGDDRPHVAAIVVNWNSGERLAQCVASLKAQSGDVKLDVVVVDNASTDDSLDRVAGGQDAARIVQTGGNLGYGSAVNRGVAETDAPYLVVLNPDVRLESKALLRLASCLAADGIRGAVGPRLYTPAGAIQASCGTAPTLWGEVCGRFLLHLIFPFLRFRRRRPSELEPVGWVTGACFMARRSALQAVGGLDEAIFMYYEDIDLCLRLQAEGWQVCYLPEAAGSHVGGASSCQVLESMLVASEESYGHFVRKHFGRFGSVVLSALMPVEMALRSLLWHGVRLVRPTRREEARTRLRAYHRIVRQDVKRAFAR
jgi:N-acetylglucosaminyl-diphospho-decaprenol L-rhamnosyltransferase